ncbi:prenyltransferase/squalene oxidase repeat-containing protein [Aureliella helgolandensis]|uniref:Prenyltransferase and squalene oxidase repeat protein n=1 Tax=Aureliella helgolandensis TaxID=2527968 RepID=A0A518GAG8_9BACT|nr:prenyltransferase/squalene oxidase repeat-containing protein [Aureliella helgolandensis]QDV25598.1 Prenyltransferase and squalene oxidase repeat protein [Aureliella helgolandensis]
MKSGLGRACVAIMVLFGSLNSGALGQVDQAQLQRTVDRGLEYLRTRGQADDGAVSPKIGIGVTALAATAMLQNGATIADPHVAKAVKIVASATQPDGGLYADDSRLRMYETCVAMLCLKMANQSGTYDGQLAKASAFLRGEQFNEADGKTPADEEYGGAGYGGKSRPDLSNTAFFIEALKSMGNPENDAAIAKALTFVSRCQNLESQYNTHPDASKVDDGGFYYTVIGEGVSAAGETADGGLRSYGSMTYSGFKSMLYAGLTPEDPRVKAARTWIEKNYSLSKNPGLGDAGLYYYYHLFAKALSVAGIDTLVDSQGVEHDWRAELVDHLASLQRGDGSWVNSNTQWMEGDPNLATTFSLLALSHCRTQ